MTSHAPCHHISTMLAGSFRAAPTVIGGSSYHGDEYLRQLNDLMSREADALAVAKRALAYRDADSAARIESVGLSHAEAFRTLERLVLVRSGLPQIKTHVAGNVALAFVDAAHSLPHSWSERAEEATLHYLNMRIVARYRRVILLAPSYDARTLAHLEGKALRRAAALR